MGKKNIKPQATTAKNRCFSLPGTPCPWREDLDAPRRRPLEESN